MSSTKFTTVVFDMDGVIVDSEKFYYQRRFNFLQEHGLFIDKIPLPELVGADMRSLWPKIAAVNNVALDIPFMTQQYVEYKKQHPLNYEKLLAKDTKRILQYLKRQHYNIGLASSSTMTAIQEVLTVAGIEPYFDVVVSGEAFEKSKPAPDIYQHVLTTLAVKPSACLAIEDSEKGIQSAKAAGLTVWAMRDRQFGMDQRHADDLIEELADICKKLEESADRNL
ncbi:HAD family hydrolase [Enterococcus faecalis]